MSSCFSKYHQSSEVTITILKYLQETQTTRVTELEVRSQDLAFLVLLLMSFDTEVGSSILLSRFSKMPLEIFCLLPLPNQILFHEPGPAQSILQLRAGCAQLTCALAQRLQLMLPFVCHIPGCIRSLRYPSK